MNTGSASADLNRHAVSSPRPPLVSSRMRTGLASGLSTRWWPVTWTFPGYGRGERDRLRSAPSQTGYSGSQSVSVKVAGHGPQQGPVPPLLAEGLDLLLRARLQLVREPAVEEEVARSLDDPGEAGQEVPVLLRHGLPEGIEIPRPGATPGHRRPAEVRLERLASISTAGFFSPSYRIAWMTNH